MRWPMAIVHLFRRLKVVFRQFLCFLRDKRTNVQTECFKYLRRSRPSFLYAVKIDWLQFPLLHVSHTERHINSAVFDISLEFRLDPVQVTCTRGLTIITSRIYLQFCLSVFHFCKFCFTKVTWIVKRIKKNVIFLFCR